MSQPVTLIGSVIQNPAQLPTLGGPSEVVTGSATPAAGVVESGGALYAIWASGLLDPCDLQVFKSSDNGITWAPFGALIEGYDGAAHVALTNPILHTTGFSTCLKGTDFWLVYFAVNGVPGSPDHICFRALDLTTGLWGVVHSHDFGVSAQYGAIFAYLRSTGKIIEIYGGVASTVWAIEFNGLVFGAPFEIDLNINPSFSEYESSILGPDDSVYVFFLDPATGIYSMQAISPANVLAAAVAMPAGIKMYANVGAVGFGILDGANFFVPVGLDRGGANAGIGVLYKIGAGPWTLTGALNPAGENLAAQPSLFLFDGLLSLVYTSITGANGASGKLRLATTDPLTYSNPAAWNFQLLYDLTAPAVPVPGIAPPYLYNNNYPWGFVTQGATELRYMAYVGNAAVVTAASYLLSIGSGGPPPPPTPGIPTFYLDALGLRAIVLPNPAIICGSSRKRSAEFQKQTEVKQRCK